MRGRRWHRRHRNRAAPCERGFEVILVEAQQIGWGASGRSGAQVLPGVAAGQEKLEKLIGAADARKVWEVSIEGVRLVRELIARHGIDAQFIQGHMLTAVKPRHERELRAHVEELQQRYAYPGVRYMPRDEVRSIIASERYLGAMYDPNAGHLQPLNYTRGLAAAAERRGARAYSSARARLSSAAMRHCACAPPAEKFYAGSWCCAAMYTSERPPRSCSRGSWPWAPALWPASLWVPQQRSH